MTDEELFKKNFPEYVTEKGVFLSPYWDLFSAGYETLEAENAELNDKLKNLASVAEVRLGMWQKYEKENKETQGLLDKQIEATYKVVEKLNKAEEILKEFVEWANWQGNSKCPSFKSIQDKAEEFLKR